MKLALVALASLACLIAFGCKENAKPPPPSVAACARGDAKSCFAAGYYFQGIDGSLDRASDHWRRGCELGNGMSCGQLGIAAEHGLSGRRDMTAAMAYYRKACTGGDTESCQRIGQPKAPAAIDWTTPLTDIVGAGREPGPLFGGWKLGEPLAADVKARVDAWATKFHARVYVRVPDETTRGIPKLEINFDQPAGIWKALVAKFGRSDRDTGFWPESEHHMQMLYEGDGKVGTLLWTPYKSIADVVLLDDKTRLGIEPIPLIGATVEATRAAQPARRIFQDGLDEWSYYDHATTEIRVRLVTKNNSIIKRARIEIEAYSPKHITSYVDAMTAKLGPPTQSKGTYSWRGGGRRYTLEKLYPKLENNEDIVVSIE